MKKLIINADDFGYSRGVNLGIIDSFERGVLTSTTLMSNMPGFDHAIELANEHPDLGVGVHLTLTCGQPLLSESKSLMDEDGTFHKLKFYETKFSIDQDELYKEWKAQIEKVQAQLSPTHLDSHHHVNSIDGITEVFCQLAREYNLPVRNNFFVPDDLKTTQVFEDFDSIARNKSIWKHMDHTRILQFLDKYHTVELMCHPAYVDALLLNNSSFNVDRTYTLKELTDEFYLKFIKDNDILLSTYSSL